MPNPIAIFPPHLTQMIDHIVPLASVMKIPLLCLDRASYELILADYPPMDLLLEEKDPQTFLAPYDTLFYTSLYRLGSLGFQFDEVVYPRKLRSVCTLHGHSDKKNDQFWWERLIDEDIILLYGQSALDSLEAKGVLHRVQNRFFLGNLRAYFYEKHQAFFDAKMPAWLKGKKNILYAPTWHPPFSHLQDRHETSSFFVAAKKLIQSMAHGWQLIIKLHPLLTHFFPEEVEELKKETASKQNIFFLEHFPLVYPLLNQIDVYLGDHSSMGYDFLYFDKPLFFLNHNQSDKALHRCGHVIEPKDFKYIYSTISDKLAMDQQQYGAQRKAAYAYAFAQQIDYDLLREKVMEALC